MAYNFKSFTFWVSYYDMAQELTPKEQGAFYRAITDYIFVGIDREAELPKMARMAFKLAKANLKRSMANRRESDANRDAIEQESDANRGEVPEAENALNLKLKLNSKSKSNPNSNDGPDGGGSEPPSCPVCGRISIRHPHKRDTWFCPKCETAVSE